MVRRKTHQKTMIEDWPEGLLDGWINAFTFVKQDWNDLESLGLSENAISQLQEAVGSFIWYRAKRKSAKLPPSEICKELKNCEKRTAALLESLRGISSYTRTLLWELTYSLDDSQFIDRLQNDLSLFRSRILVPAYVNIERQKVQSNKKKRLRTDLLILANDIGTILKADGYNPTTYRDGPWVKVLGMTVPHPVSWTQAWSCRFL